MVGISGILLLGPVRGWVGDVIREGTFRGVHTQGVERTLTVGTLLFITSEVIFFFAFFWA